MRKNMPLYKRESKIDWSNVNWDRDDLSIGMSLGVHKATVRAARKRLGKPMTKQEKWKPFGRFSSHIETWD
jgi:hypothetical protein